MNAARETPGQQHARRLYATTSQYASGEVTTHNHDTIVILWAYNAQSSGAIIYPVIQIKLNQLIVNLPAKRVKAISHTNNFQCCAVLTVLLRSWLGGRKGIRPVKN